MTTQIRRLEYCPSMTPNNGTVSLSAVCIREGPHDTVLYIVVALWSLGPGKDKLDHCWSSLTLEPPVETLKRSEKKKLIFGGIVLFLCLWSGGGTHLSVLRV